MNKCKHCGKEIERLSSHCPHCSKSLLTKKKDSSSFWLGFFRPSMMTYSHIQKQEGEKAASSYAKGALTMFGIVISVVLIFVVYQMIVVK